MSWHFDDSLHMWTILLGVFNGTWYVFHSQKSFSKGTTIWMPLIMHTCLELTNFTISWHALPPITPLQKNLRLDHVELLYFADFQRERNYQWRCWEFWADTINFGLDPYSRTSPSSTRLLHKTNYGPSLPYRKEVDLICVMDWTKLRFKKA